MELYISWFLYGAETLREGMNPFLLVLINDMVQLLGKTIDRLEDYKHAWVANQFII